MAVKLKRIDPVYALIGGLLAVSLLCAGVGAFIDIRSSSNPEYLIAKHYPGCTQSPEQPQTVQRLANCAEQDCGYHFGEYECKTKVVACRQSAPMASVSVACLGRSFVVNCVGGVCWEGLE